MRTTIAFALVASLFLGGCDGMQFISKGEVESMQKQSADLRMQIDKLNRDLTTLRDEMAIKTMTVNLYTLRHALDKYAFINRGAYPMAENLTQLKIQLKDYLPKDFEIDDVALESIKSTDKGYILVANVSNQKIIVSNLI